MTNLLLPIPLFTQELSQNKRSKTLSHRLKAFLEFKNSQRRKYATSLKSRILEAPRVLQLIKIALVNHDRNR